MVPVGGGSGACGTCITAKAVRPSIEVIGVQAEAAPAAYRSWQAGTLVEDTTRTFAEGLATRTAFELPQQILRDFLNDFVLVTEDALRAATRVMIEKTHNLVEPAGAAALAAVLAAPQRFAGRPVAVRVFEGNTGDPAAFTGIVQVVREEFGLAKMVMVGDRGMITSARIDALNRLEDGTMFNW